MKYVFLKRAYVILGGVLLLLGTNTLRAQNDVYAYDSSSNGKGSSKTRIDISVEKGDSGRSKTMKRAYEVDPMTDEEQNKFVEAVLDSLGVKEGSNDNVSVEIRQGMKDSPKDYHGKKREKIREIPKREGFRFDSKEFERDMRDAAREVGPKFQEIAREMGRAGDEFQNAVGINASKTIGGLSAYPNKPADGLINVRFSANQEGNVVIWLTNVEGKEVGRKEIKNFKGDYVGQVSLQEEQRGTLFIHVTQNGDGDVKSIPLARD